MYLVVLVSLSLPLLSSRPSARENQKTYRQNQNCFQKFPFLFNLKTNFVDKKMLLLVYCLQVLVSEEICEETNSWLLYLLLCVFYWNLLSQNFTEPCIITVSNTGCPTKHDSWWIVLNVFFHILYETKDFLQFISLKKSFTQVYFTLKQFYFKYNCQIILFIILFDIKQLKNIME